MIREEDTRFKHLEKKIGAFAAVAILGIIAVLLLIGMEQEFFTAKYTLRFTVEKGTGFSRGMPVKLSGFRIGHIKSISLNEKAMVDIRIQIDKQYQKWIRKDSVARLVKEGLVGDNIIEVSVGTPTAPLLKDGDTIVYEKTRGLEEVANDIADKVKPVLVEVRDIISYINDPNGDIKQSLGNIRRLTGNLEGTRQNTDDLLITTRTSIGTVAGTANRTLENANARINSLEPLMAKMDSSLAKIPPILEKVDDTMANVEKSTLELRKAAPRIQPLLSKTEDTMESADTVLKALKETWPLKNHIPVPSDREFVPGDSHD